MNSQSIFKNVTAPHLPSLELIDHYELKSKGCTIDLYTKLELIEYVKRFFGQDIVEIEKVIAQLESSGYEVRVIPLPKSKSALIEGLNKFNQIKLSINVSIKTKLINCIEDDEIKSSAQDYWDNHVEKMGFDQRLEFGKMLELLLQANK
jgi:hypothetical protein